jgi:hypothetical protein
LEEENNFQKKKAKGLAIIRQPFFMDANNCNFMVFSQPFFGIDFSLLHFCNRL